FVLGGTGIGNGEGDGPGRQLGGARRDLELVQADSDGVWGGADCDRLEHAGLEVTGQVAHEQVGAGLGQVNGAGLALAGVEVVAVGHLCDAGSVLVDVAVVERIGGGVKVASEYQQLVLDG